MHATEVPLLPIYLVIDVAEVESAVSKRETTNRILPAVVAALRKHPAAAAHARIGLIGFAGYSRLCLPLTDVLNPRFVPPQLIIGGRRSYISAFRALNSRISSDLQQMRNAGHSMDRPVALFVTDGAAEHTEDWRSEFGRLTTGPERPAIIPIGFGIIEQETVEQLAHPSGRFHYLPPGTDPVPTIAEEVVEQADDSLRRCQADSEAVAVATDRAPAHAHVPVPAGTAHDSRSRSGPEDRTFHDSAGAHPGPRHAQADNTATVASAPSHAFGVSPLPAVSATEAPATTATHDESARPASGPVGPVAADIPNATSSPNALPGRAGAETQEWKGRFDPFSVGDPGRAAALVRPIPDLTEWDWRDTVLDGVCIRDHADAPALELRAASVRGLSHRFAGTVRQDDYAYQRTRDGRFLVAVVSDGVSSSKLSHHAAALITRCGCAKLAELLEKQPPDQLNWGALAHDLADQVVELGRKLLVDRPGDAVELTRAEVAGHLAATALLAVVAVRPGDEEIPVHLFAIGDSPAWVLRDGTIWEPQQTIKNEGSAIASSRTKVLPLLPTELDPPVATTLRPADVLVLMTDGIGDPLGDGNGPVGRFLAQVWSRPPAPLKFAAHVDFARRTHDDDRTALAIWPERGP